MCRIGLYVLTALTVTWAASAADKLPKPDRVSAPPTAEQITLIREGVALHDQKNYEGAIAKYKQVLSQNAWETTALHELAYTYFESRKFQEALDTALLGAQCRSQLLPAFYTMMGNALDELGKGNEAIAVYKAAIKQTPSVALLQFNFAVSLRRAGKQEEAKKAVETALFLDPNHAGSHAVLGSIYQEMGYRVPAILAFSRFLVLEPDSNRSADVLPKLADLLGKGVAKGTDGSAVTILMSLPDKKLLDEGDFGSVELMMSMNMALDVMKKGEEAKTTPKSPFQKVSALYESMGESLDIKKSKGFAASYYAPYFTALVKAGLTDAFTAAILKTSTTEGRQEWVDGNPGKLDAFLAWSKAYSWPTK